MAVAVSWTRQCPDVKGILGVILQVAHTMAWPYVMVRVTFSGKESSLWEKEVMGRTLHHWGRAECLLSCGDHVSHGKVLRIPIKNAEKRPSAQGLLLGSSQGLQKFYIS